MMVAEHSHRTYPLHMYISHLSHIPFKKGDISGKDKKTYSILQVFPRFFRFIRLGIRNGVEDIWENFSKAVALNHENCFISANIAYLQAQGLVF